MIKSISHVVLAHGEPGVLELCAYLQKWKAAEDKVWVLNDPTTPEFKQSLTRCQIRVVDHVLGKDYSAHRNVAVDKCNTEYLWMHDADEMPHTELLQTIHAKLEEAQWPDAVWMPRLNLFEGVLPIHALQFGWSIQNGNVVNWPDPQCRLVQLGKGIRWVGALHERPKLDPRLHRVIRLPDSQENAIIHRKSIVTQLQQNARYNSEFSMEQNMEKETQELLKG
jgi:hypothetical protein